MGDDIEINVTETTNIIEITPQPNDQIVDIAVTDNAPNVEINVTPSVVEINVTRGSSTAIWGSIEGNLTDQSDLVTALGLKADLIDGKVPSTQLPSYVDDVIEVANYAALPTSGEVGKIYVTLDNNKIYRWSGSIYIEIAANQAIWGAITGNLGDQLDLQNALNTKEPTITAGTTSQYWRGDKSWQTLDKNAVGLGNVDNTSDLNKPISTATQTALNGKFNNPTGDTTQYIAGDGSLITFPISGQAGTIVREVRNTTGATLTKGTIVYISGATGNKATISKAIATGDSTSAQTFGLLQADISNNSNGYVVILGDLIGLDTSGITEGSQLYLSSTVAGAYTTTKQVAPAHLVYIGVVTRSHPSLGQIEVKIQNGYELDEIHDVSITSKANNQFLVYESASNLWKNKSLSTILGGTSSQFLKGDGSLDSTAYVPTARTLTINGTAYDLSANRSWTIPTHDAVTIGTANGLSLSTQVLSLGLSSASANGALSSTDWTTFNNKQGALNGTGFVKILGTTISYDNSTYALDNVVVKLSGSQTIDGSKTFLADTYLDNNIYLKKTGSWANPANYSVIGGMTHGFFLSSGTNKHAYLDLFQLTQARQYSFPNQSGTFAMTSDIPTISGDANYISKFTGANTLGNSAIYDDSGKIGIGSITPQVKLSVHGSQNNTISPVNGVFKSVSGDVGIFMGGLQGTPNYANWIQSMRESDGLTFQLLLQPNGGNILIGTTTDAGYKLDVNGTGRFNGSLQVGQGSAGSGTPTQSVFQDTYGGNREAIYVKNTADYSNGRGTGYGFLSGSGTQKGYIRWSADDASQAGYFITLGTTNSSGTLIAPLTLASNGAALFSNNVQSSSLNVAGSGYFPSKLITLSGAEASRYSSNIGLNIVYGSTLAMSFGTRSNNVDYDNTLNIINGQIGIGTLSPDYKLSVNGPSSFGVSTINGNPTNDFSIFRGISISDGSNSYGSYGGFILNANTQWTASAKRFLITNILGANKFAIIRSTDAATNPSIGTNGVISSGTPDFVINDIGNVGVGSDTPRSKLEIASSLPFQIFSSGLAIESATDNQQLAGINFYKHYGIGSAAAIRMLHAGGTGAYANAHLAFYTNNNSNPFSSNPEERMRIFANGNVSLGSSTPADNGYRFQVNGGQFGTYLKGGDYGTGSNILLLVDAGGNPKYQARGDGRHFFTGNMDVSGTVTASGGFFNSDIRLKDVTDYDYNVSEIKPMNYYWKDKRDEKKHVGYSAQEVQKVMPDAVNEDENGMLSVNYIEVLVAKIAQMENRIKQLENGLE